MAKDVSASFSAHSCHDCQKILQAQATNAALWMNTSSATSALGQTGHTKYPCR